MVDMESYFKKHLKYYMRIVEEAFEVRCFPGTNVVHQLNTSRIVCNGK